MSASGIRRDEWLAAVAETAPVPADDPEAITLREFMEMVGAKRWVAQHRMKLLVDAGRAVQTSRRVCDTSGRAQTVPAYRLVTP